MIEIDLHKKPDDRPDEFTRHLTRVGKLAIAAAVVGGIAGLGFAIAYLLEADDFPLDRVVGAPVVLGFVCGGMVMGCAVLFAPAGFFTSPRGQACMQAIGTRKVGVARFIILIFLLLGCGFIALFAMGALQMAGVIPPPVRR